MKTYVRLMLAGFTFGAFAGVYSELTRTPGTFDAAGNGTTALIFGILGAAFGAVLAFLLRLLLSFRS